MLQNKDMAGIQSLASQPAEEEAAEPEEVNEAASMGILDQNYIKQTHMKVK